MINDKSSQIKIEEKNKTSNFTKGEKGKKLKKNSDGNSGDSKFAVMKKDKEESSSEEYYGEEELYSSYYSKNYHTKYKREKIYGIFGFKNNKLSNNCFINSSLQNLLHCDKFKSFLNTIPERKLIDKPLTKNVKKLIERIKKGDDELDPNDIKTTLATIEEKYQYNEQNDANEFITIFLNQLLKELNKCGDYETIKNIPDNELEEKAFQKLENRFFLKNNSFLLNLFYGRIKRDYICKNRHLCMVKFNNFNTLILPQPTNSNYIVDLLNLYQEEKQINDTLFCRECQKDMEYSIKTSIYSVPEYLILCLEKENLYSSSGLKYQKLLKTNEFMENNNSIYYLNSLIVYLGNRKFGHYIAKCSQDKKWYYISDNYYTEIGEEEVNDRNAIILFYSKY